MPVIDIVAEDQAGRGATNEVGADHVGLGKPVRAWLNGIFDRETPLGAVFQKVLEKRHVMWCRYDEDLANAGQHQRRQRIIDHRLVVNGQDLL